MSKPRPDPEAAANAPAPAEPVDPSCAEEVPREIGGRKGLDPVRYGDWEKNGRCIDFLEICPGF